MLGADAPVGGIDAGNRCSRRFSTEKTRVSVPVCRCANRSTAPASVHIFFDEAERALGCDLPLVGVPAGVLHQLDPQHMSIGAAFHAAADHERMLPIAEVPHPRQGSGTGVAELKPDEPGQSVEIFVAGHGAAQLVQHEPSRLVGHADLFGKRGGADRSAGDERDGGEPFSQGNAASLHDGAGNERDIDGGKPRRRTAGADGRTRDNVPRCRSSGTGNRRASALASGDRRISVPNNGENEDAGSFENMSAPPPFFSGLSFILSNKCSYFNKKLVDASMKFY